MSGYVRLYRDLIGHPAFRNDAEAMAFAWMIARAAWKPTRVRYKERGIHLARGQLSVSQRDMARALDRDKAWVERLWKRLRAEAMITVASEAGVALITICNYNEYQAPEDTGEASGEARGEAGARQGRGTEQRREEGKEEKGTRRRARPSFELPDWIPEDAWKAFEEMRKAIPRVPFTDAAKRGIVIELEKLKAQGHCPEKLLLKAVKKGWRSVFPGDDTKASATGGPVDMAEYQARLARLDERLGRGPDGFAETRREATGPPGQPVGRIADNIVKQARAGAG